MSSDVVMVVGRGQFIELVECHKTLQATEFDSFPDDLAESHPFLFRNQASTKTWEDFGDGLEQIKNTLASL
jgi:hypothetical protein